jgi:twitching motility protein PilJ
MEIDTSHGAGPVTDISTAKTGLFRNADSRRMWQKICTQLKNNALVQPWLAYWSVKLALRILQIGLVLSLITLASFAWLNSQETARASVRTQIAGDLVMHSQRLGKAAPNAIQGNRDAFIQLEQSRMAINEALRILSAGGDWQGRAVPVPDLYFSKRIVRISNAWQRSDQSAVKLMALQKELTGFGTTLQTLNQLNPGLLELAEQVAIISAQSGTSAREVAAAGQLVMLTQRLGKSANEFLTPEGINQDTAFMLGRDANTFQDIITGFLEGSPVLRLPALSNPDARARLLAEVASLPGLPEGMRISISWRSANRLISWAAPSTELQSKCAPLTVNTCRSP